MSTIEDIILTQDRRGISALRPFLPPDFCHQAAQLILDHPGHAIVATGFYIPASQSPETDGPPGAIAIGRALQELGYQVSYISDRYTVPFLEPETARGAHVVDFPITTPRRSQALARKLLRELDPSVLIAIERCGLTRDGKYRNMRGADISPFTGRVDYLFMDHPHTVGIGDGGNEIGMGNLYHQVQEAPTLVRDPAATRVSRLVIASVSNWGGYGLVAALSVLQERNLLISAAEEARLIQGMVDRGAVDGITEEARCSVDTFPLEENSRILQELHRHIGLRLGGGGL